MLKNNIPYRVKYIHWKIISLPIHLGACVCVCVLQNEAKRTQGFAILGIFQSSLEEKFTIYKNQPCCSKGLRRPVSKKFWTGPVKTLKMNTTASHLRDGFLNPIRFNVKQTCFTSTISWQLVTCNQWWLFTIQGGHNTWIIQVYYGPFKITSAFVDASLSPTGWNSLC